MDADEEAMQHVVALAHRFHEFGHRTKECELEIWDKLSGAINLSGVERLMARN